MTILQAIDYLNCADRLSTRTHELYIEVRKFFPKFVEDSIKYKDIQRVKDYFENEGPLISSKTISSSAVATP